jgi:muramoyltetrapeptide carboxypeptidase
MNRKHFITAVIGTAAVLPLEATAAFSVGEEEDKQAPLLIPRSLKPGDTIGITAPAGYITEKDVLSAIQQIESWGFKVKTGATIGKRDFTFGGTDEERMSDFQAMLEDKKIKAILCARGGYGVVRLIDRLNFSAIRTNPKWIIGFSDITILHCHLNRNYRVASVHSKMCNSFPEDWSKAEPIQIETILSIRDVLRGTKMKYTALPHAQNRNGKAVAELVGGNLKTLESLAGTKSDIRTAGKILFLEDTGEYLYSIDRMFWNLKRTGKLDKLAGLIIGGFKVKPSEDPNEEFGKTLQEIVLEKIREFKYPVCFDFPVGHQKNNFALKCGVKHALEVKETSVNLQEF